MARKMTSSYNPEYEAEVKDEETKRKEWVAKRHCTVEGCELPGTLHTSPLCVEETKFYCSYHDLFPGSDVADVVTNVLKQHSRLFKIQTAAMRLQINEFDALQANPDSCQLGENIKPVSGENYIQWLYRIKHSVRAAVKSKCREAVERHRAIASSYGKTQPDGLSAALKAITDGSLLHN